jgi:hypothetical protein
MNNLDAIQRALEAAGVEFTNGGQPGVRIKPKPRDPSNDDPPKGWTWDLEESDQDPTAE